MTKTMRRFATFALLALLLAGAGRVLWWQRLPVVAETEVAAGDVAEVVYATGVVEPVFWAKVVPKLRDRVVSHCQCEGHPVRKGDILVSLDDDEALAQLRELEGRLGYAARHLDRTNELARRNVTTADALERAQADVLQINALIAAQKERIDTYKLRAPMDGVVLRRDFEIGEIVSTSDVVAWVGQPKPLRIVAEIAEEDVVAVAPGQSALLRHDGFKEARLEAKVDRLTPKGDTAQKTFRAYLSLPDGTPLRIGMSVEANIVLQARNGVLTLPVQAVRDNAVMVRDGELLRRKTVATGLRDLNRIEITSGLAAGERIVASYAPGLREGQRTRLATETLRAAFGWGEP
jgi:membrane fusion protein, multidrug efflux system